MRGVGFELLARPSAVSHRSVVTTTSGIDRAVGTNTLSAADPERVGHDHQESEHLGPRNKWGTVRFAVTLTVTGDTSLTDVMVVDTFENRFLAALTPLPAGCTMTTRNPDVAHHTITCRIPAVVPGTPANPGTTRLDYTFSFRALTSTPPAAP